MMLCMHYIDIKGNLVEQVAGRTGVEYLRRGIVLAALAAGGLGQASAQTVVKGHHLGETADEFLAAEPAIKAHLAQCDEYKHKVTPAEVDGKTDMQVLVLATKTAMMSGLPSKPDRSQLRSMAAEGKIIDFNEEYNNGDVLECVRQVAALENRHAAWFHQSNSDWSKYWTFADGQLVGMRLELPAATFPQLVADLAKRVGANPTETHPSYQNAMGATWVDNEAIWLTGELFADLHESNNPAKPKLTLELETREKHDKEAKARAEAPSPLD